MHPRGLCWRSGELPRCRAGVPAAQPRHIGYQIAVAPGKGTRWSAHGLDPGTRLEPSAASGPSCLHLPKGPKPPSHPVPASGVPRLGGVKCGCPVTVGHGTQTHGQQGGALCLSQQTPMGAAACSHYGLCLPCTAGHLFTCGLLPPWVGTGDCFVLFSVVFMLSHLHLLAFLSPLDPHSFSLSSQYVR